MKDLLELIVKQLVDNPDDVNVNEISGEQTSVFEL
ncbi:MAG: RNA-binding protein, partial [Proteobacteria bacterium]|nr:RNA-binding protein [Pseudomonadota bacterium]